MSDRSWAVYLITATLAIGGVSELKVTFEEHSHLTFHFRPLPFSMQTVQIHCDAVLLEIYKVSHGAI